MSYFNFLNFYVVNLKTIINGQYDNNLFLEILYVIPFSLTFFTYQKKKKKKLYVTFYIVLVFYKNT